MQSPGQRPCQSEDCMQLQSQCISGTQTFKQQSCTPQACLPANVKPLGGGQSVSVWHLEDTGI